MSEIIIDNDCVTLEYWPEIGCVYHIFHRTAQSYELRETLDAGIETLRRHGATKWLSDDSRNNAISADDRVWTATNWGPRAAAAGWKYWAMVVPEEIAGRLDMADVVEHYYDMGVVIRVFLNITDAQNWLVQQ